MTCVTRRTRRCTAPHVQSSNSGRSGAPVPLWCPRTSGRRLRPSNLAVRRPIFWCRSETTRTPCRISGWNPGHSRPSRPPPPRTGPGGATTRTASSFSCTGPTLVRTDLTRTHRDSLPWCTGRVTRPREGTSGEYPEEFPADTSAEPVRGTNSMRNPQDGNHYFVLDPEANEEEIAAMQFPQPPPAHQQMPPPAHQQPPPAHQQQPIRPMFVPSGRPPMADSRTVPRGHPRAPPVVEEKCTCDHSSPGSDHNHVTNEVPSEIPLRMVREGPKTHQTPLPQQRRKEQLALAASEAHIYNIRKNYVQIDIRCITIAWVRKDGKHRFQKKTVLGSQGLEPCLALVKIDGIHGRIYLSAIIHLM